MLFENQSHPHDGQPVLEKGKPLSEAAGTVILIHGRGASADSILSLYKELELLHPSVQELAWLAPQANNHTWYPYTFLSPTDQNEPGLSSGLKVIGELVEKAESAGIPKEKIVLAGFSQGACLSLEYAAQNPDRYGGVVALSGGLIGEEVDRDRYRGSMKHTPVFIGCSDYDPHIPEHRVHESADIFERLDADVTKVIYEGLGHTVNREELEHFRDVLKKVLER